MALTTVGAVVFFALDQGADRGTLTTFAEGKKWSDP